MEYNSAIKKKEILPFATTWIKLEGIMLSETSDREKQIQWTLEQHGFERHGSTYNQIFSNSKYYGTTQSEVG